MNKHWKREHFKLLLSGSENDLRKAANLRFQNRPKNIYRYQKIDQMTLENLENEIIKFSSPLNFNDPYDCALQINIYKIWDWEPMALIFEQVLSILKDKYGVKTIDKIRKSPHRWEAVKRLLIKNSPSQEATEALLRFEELFRGLNDEKTKMFDHECRQKMKIVCFTENHPRFAMNMWAHYADDYKGICLEYNLAKCEENEFHSSGIYPVFYTRKIFDPLQFLENWRDDILRHRKLTLAAISKANHWAYEKEWRKISVENGEYNEFKFKPDKIYIGFKADYLKNKVLEIARKKAIMLYSCEPKNNLFELKLTKI